MGSNRRPKKNKEPIEQFAMLTRSVLFSDAWIALSSTAKALYPYLRLQYRHKNNNNGEIRLSVRDAAALLGVGRDTVSRAFLDLQAKGFIVVTEIAVLGIDGHGRCSAFELTEVPLKGVKGPGRMLFKNCEKGEDFPVSKAAAHNPSGRNSKKQNPVTKRKTQRHQSADVV